MDLHSWLSTVFGTYTQATWVMHAVVIFLAATVTFWLQRKIIKHFQVQFIKTPHVWDDSLLHALSPPLSLLIWIFAATSFAEYMLINLQEKEWLQAVVRLRTGCYILLLLWFFWRYIDQVEYRLINPLESRQKVDVTTVSVIGRFARIGLTMAAFLILLEGLGIPLSGVIAFGGGGAIVMGIAAQQLLANWFGGLIIFLDKPFQLGDWIQSPDRNIEGCVTRIGWRTTKVMTIDTRPLYIPNAVFNQVVIVNTQRMTHRRIDTVLSIRYEDAHLLKDLVEAIDSMLRSHPNIDPKQAIMVHLMKFGACSLDINLCCFTNVTASPHWRDVQQDVFFRVIAIIQAHKAQFSFPTMTTHIPDGITIRGDLHA